MYYVICLSIVDNNLWVPGIFEAIPMYV
jgi:hypothetical protein